MKVGTTERFVGKEELVPERQYVTDLEIRFHQTTRLKNRFSVSNAKQLYQQVAEIRLISTAT